MVFKEFPRIEVDLKFRSTEPLFDHNLAVHRKYSNLAHVLTMPVESSGLFLGGNIDLYRDWLGYTQSKGEPVLTRGECLDFLVNHMLINKWICAVVLKEGSNEVATILGDDLPVREAQVKGSLDQLLFTPTPDFAERVWGFSYDPALLMKVADYRLPPELREQYEDLIGELSQTMLQMKKGENCNPKHLTELFRAMSHPLFKEFMEGFFKRTFQHYSSIVLSRLIPYAEKSGFNIRL